MADNNGLKARVLASDMSSHYRDYKSAVAINSSILAREQVPNEIRINTTNESPGQVVQKVLAYLDKPQESGSRA